MNYESGHDAKVSELLDSQPFGVLVTKSEYPHTSLVSFWVSKDTRKLVFLTARDTRKYDNISRDAKAAIMVDDRTNNPRSDIRKASSVTALGTVREAEGEEARMFLEQFLGRHPYMEAFAAEKDTAVMVLDVDSFQVVSRFQV